MWVWGRHATTAQWFRRISMPRQRVLLCRGRHKKTHNAVFRDQGHAVSSVRAASVASSNRDAVEQTREKWSSNRDAVEQTRYPGKVVDLCWFCPGRNSINRPQFGAKSQKC